MATPSSTSPTPACVDGQRLATSASHRRTLRLYGNPRQVFVTGTGSLNTVIEQRGKGARQRRPFFLVRDGGAPSTAASARRQGRRARHPSTLRPRAGTHPRPQLRLSKPAQYIDAPAVPPSSSSPRQRLRIHVRLTASSGTAWRDCQPRPLFKKRSSSATACPTYYFTIAACRPRPQRRRRSRTLIGRLGVAMPSGRAIRRSPYNLPPYGSTPTCNRHCHAICAPFRCSPAATLKYGDGGIHPVQMSAYRFPLLRLPRLTVRDIAPMPE